MFNKIIISKNNLINNIKQVKQINPNSKICAMVKANAYGVGINQVVSVIDYYVDFYGVACFFEACKLKELTDKKILIVGPVSKDIDTRFSYTCSSLEDVKYLISLNKRVNIHLKVNSGMNRFGFKSLKNFKKALNMIKGSKLHLEGVFTHFATGDDYVRNQNNIFKKFIRNLGNMYKNVIIHADNSIVNLKQNHHYDMVRIGFNLYNLNKLNFKPVVNIKSKVVQLNVVKRGELIGYGYKGISTRPTTVAIIPIGYADGFSTKYIGLYLWVGNVKCRVINVCMDCFMLDVSNTNIKKGTEIFVLNKFNPLSHYSKYAGINEYEVLTNFSNMRADRVLY